MKSINTVILVSVLVISPMLAAAQAPPVGAADSNVLDEIIVTATKRATRLEDTPIAIGIVSGEEVRELHISGLGDVAKYALSFQVGDNSVVPSAVILTIRGLQSNTLIPSGDPSAAPHIDGIYTSRGSPRAGIFDVERIEILRGPQGTLFGRNSTSGAINIVTAKPEFKRTGYVSAGVGNDGFGELLGAISLPLSQTVAVRAAGFKRKHDGYQKNLFAGSPDMADDDSSGGRLSLRWQPSEQFKLDASIDHTDVGGAGANYQVLNASGLVQDAQVANTNIPHILRYRGGGESLEVTYSLDDVDLVGLFGHRYVNDFSQADVDGTSLTSNRAQFINEQRSYFEEIRAQSYGAGKLGWTIGANYYDDNLHTDRPFTIDIPGPNELEVRAIYPGNTVKSYAAFGNIDYEVRPDLAFNAGVRYTHDNKSFPNARVETTLVTPTGRLPPALRSVANEVSFSKSTWTAGVSYKPVDGILAYAKAATGYKAGGSEQGVTYRPETVLGFEAGLKMILMDRMVTLNLAAFHNDYKDLQIAKTVNALTIVENAATAKTKGLELEATIVPGNGLTIRAGISALSGKYGSYVDATDPRNPLSAAQRASGLRGPDLSGNSLPDAPDLDVLLSISKDIKLDSGTVTPGLNLHYSSRYWGTEFNDFGAYGVLGQKASTRFDVSLNYAARNGWSVRAWSQNVGDEVVQTFAAVGGTGSLIGAYANPRTYGLNFSYDF